LVERQVIRLARRYTAYVQDSGVPFRYVAGTFLVFVTLRNFLEIFSDRTPVSLQVHMHYYLFHISAALAVTLLFSLATREPTEKSARIVFFSYFLVLLAPLFDLLLSGGAGHDISYLLPGYHDDLLARYLTFGGGSEAGGITIGLKLEGVVILSCSYLYFRAKGLSIARSLLSILAIYTCVFGLAMIPFLIGVPLQALGLLESLADESLFVKANLLLALALLVPVAWRWSRALFAAVVRSLRPYRLAHALLMLTLGISLSAHFEWTQSTPFDLLLAGVSVLSACLFVITISDIQDSQSGHAAKPEGARANGQLTLGAGAGLLALFSAGVVAYELAFLTLLAMGLYYLYATPPLRLKRSVVISKLPIALASLACMLMGYVYGGSDIREIRPLIVLWFMVPFALAANLIDLKDYDEDSEAGIRTLPVRWGLRRSQQAIGALVLVAYGTAPHAFGSPRLFLPAVAAGGVQFGLIMRRRYREQQVLGLYLVSIGVLAAAGVLVIS
jgi:4-hydroxybenzoate polyprenyltransferase